MSTTVTIGGVEINPNIVWTDRWSYNSVVSSAKRTLQGSLVVFSAQLQKGRPITLEANQSQGWLTAEQYDAILAQSEQLGAQFTFDYHSEETFTVMYNTTRPPAVDMRELVPHIPRASYYIGTISLFTV